MCTRSTNRASPQSNRELAGLPAVFVAGRMLSLVPTESRQRREGPNGSTDRS